MFRRKFHTYPMPIMIPTGGGSPFMSSMHMGITIVTTFAGFAYGNMKLYQLHQDKIRYHEKLETADVIDTIAMPTLIGVIVGLAYPIGLPMVGIYQYYKWQEQQNNNFTYGK